MRQRYLAEDALLPDFIIREDLNKNQRHTMQLFQLTDADNHLTQSTFEIRTSIRLINRPVFFLTSAVKTADEHSQRRLNTNMYFKIEQKQ